ncbi:MAG TPA: zf-HC2 domain-containing protein [Acetobacteraceae bacterium]|nr:zf-HC2 domain-containing protein [Acetobacteraceae bacterium]
MCEAVIPTCRDMAELVTGYLEGTLSIRTRAAARLHLAVCDACTRYYDQMRRTIRLLGGTPPPAPSEGTEERVIRAALPPGQGESGGS